jgi:transposase InsO family protein
LKGLGIRTQHPFQDTPHHDGNRSLLYETFQRFPQHVSPPPVSLACTPSQRILLTEGGFVQLALPPFLRSILVSTDISACCHLERAGFLYLAVVVDALRRRAVGWSMANHLRTELVLEALDLAIWQRLPDSVIHHSDRAASTPRWRSVGAPNS